MAKTKERSTKEVSFDGITLNFSKSPEVYKFLQNNDFVQGLMGPVGSGKSYACCAKIFIKALEQTASPIAKDNNH